MGGRKGKGCNQNILNGIIYDVLKNINKHPVMFQLFDYAQMLEHAISDVYEPGLSLVYEANKEVFGAVDTPDGLMQCHALENTVLQGDTFGSLLASAQVDSIGQKFAKTGYILEVGMLGLVDDSVLEQMQDIKRK